MGPSASVPSIESIPPALDLGRGVRLSWSVKADRQIVGFRLCRPRARERVASGRWEPA